MGQGSNTMQLIYSISVTGDIVMKCNI